MSQNHPAAEKPLQKSLEKPLGLVPQDSALDDYLDGLLKDDAFEPPQPLIKLALVTSPPVAMACPVAPPSFTDTHEDSIETALEPRAISALNPLHLTLEMPPNPKLSDALAVADMAATLPPSWETTPYTGLAMQPNALVDAAALLDRETLQAVDFIEPIQEAIPHKIDMNCRSWQVFSAGAFKIALRRAEIKQVLNDVALQPILGAPSNVAGVVNIEGQHRMVLALPDWLGQPKSAAHILTFGAQGLWGLAVGDEWEDLCWDEAQTTWREAGEQNLNRPGFIGFNSGARLVFLDPAELRALFNSSAV